MQNVESPDTPCFIKHTLKDLKRYVYLKIYMLSTYEKTTIFIQGKAMKNL